MGRVVVVGSLNMDLIVRTPHIPAVGETIIGSVFYTAPGGKGANQAVAAARLGAQVSILGCVGKDNFAAELLQSLDHSGVNYSYIRQDDEAATGVALIEVDDEGQNSIIVASGANYALKVEDIETSAEFFAGADIVLLQLENPLETVQRAAELAHEHGAQVILNPAPAQSLKSELLRKIDILVPNESEAALLTGLPVDTQAEVEAAADRLHEMGLDTIIITLGKRGALLSARGKKQLFPAYQVKAVDTTAAGDAFLGGLGAALSDGKSVEEGIRWGNAAGALAVTKMGAQPSLPLRREVEELLEGNQQTNKENSGY
jgi:ribokinase